MVLSYTTSKLDQILPKLENAFCFNLTTKPVYIICICSSTTITELQITSYAPYIDSTAAWARCPCTAWCGRSSRGRGGRRRGPARTGTGGSAAGPSSCGMSRVRGSASKSSIRRFVITGLLLVESGYYRFHI